MLVKSGGRNDKVSSMSETVSAGNHLNIKECLLSHLNVTDLNYSELYLIADLKR